MTLERGRITSISGGPSPRSGVLRQSRDTCVRGAPLLPSPVLARFLVGVTMLLSIAAVGVSGNADGAPRSWSEYLAPAGLCEGAEDAAAAPIVQRRSIRCLVNWARAQDRRGRVGRSRALQRAAALKGIGVASCGQFSHTPCSAAPTDAVRAAGYRYSTFGENLFVGTHRRVAPRDVVLAWLQSPSHRANLLGSGFRELGIARVKAHGLVGDVDSVVWVAAFGAPR